MQLVLSLHGNNECEITNLPVTDRAASESLRVADAVLCELVGDRDNGEINGSNSACERRATAQ